MKKLVWLFAVVLFAKVTFAQVLGTGRYSFGSFDDRGFDSVNLGNLNVRFNIPLVNRPGRGMGFNYSLQYEGLIWTASTSGGTPAWIPDPQWGFNGLLNGTAFVGYISHVSMPRSCPRPPNYSGVVPPTADLSRFTYHDAFGATHLFNYSVKGGCLTSDTDDQASGDGSTSDGSGYTFLASTSRVSNRNGTIVTPASSAQGQDNTGITDSNGNTITSTGGNSFKDTMGATALTVAGSSPKTFAYPVTMQSDSALSAAASISYKAYTVQTAFGCSGVTEYPATAASLVDRITLADGRFYAFTYETTPGLSGRVTARLASITLPTGGVISYAYSGGCSGAGGINADGTVGSMTRTTSDGTRTYTRVPYSTASSTTLKDEKGNQAYIAFISDAGTGRFFETHRQAYQGSIGGTPLLDRVTCYNGVTGNSCDGQALKLPITAMNVNEGYNGVQQSITKNAYDASGMLPTSVSVYNGTTLLEQINTAYNALGEATSVAKLDGSGNTFEYSSFGYDESSVTATSGIPQHGSAGTQRGNLTSTHISAGPVILNSSAAYYDTGVVKSTADPGGFTTSYGYDPTQTFATTTTLPTPTSGVALSTSASYDTQSAKLLTSTGLNGDQTKVNNYDRTLRPTNVTSPNGSVTTYDWFSAANRVVVNQTMGNGQSASSMVLLDGYGRTSRTALLATNTWYMTDYCYDAAGLLQFQTLPYAAQASFNTTKQCSGTGTTYTYDALGRMTSVANADGTATTAYQGRAVKTTDVNSVQKITQYDLLGRIAGVCEISSNAMAGQSPVACTANSAAMDITGTGYVTSYGYTLNTHTTTITQGQQTRTFQTDPAGRTILTQEPERGQTTYSYAYNGNGLQTGRTRPRANQASSSTTTTTTTQYDSLGRVVYLDYNDGFTLHKDFYYDQNNAGYGLGGTSANMKGLLVAGISGSGATRTVFQYSYDIMSHVTTMWQCAPSICGTQYNRPPVTMGYDLVGNVTSEADATTGSIVYGRSPAGQITSVTNQTYNDATNPGNLVSSVANVPFGPAVFGLGNTLNIARYYDNVGRTYASFVCPGNTMAGFNCTGEFYGDAQTFKGSRVTSFCDTAVYSNCQSPSYDEFNRLTALNGNTWTYDRWGNRLSQTGSPSVSYSADPATNRNTAFGYDAAGNQTNDALHSYTYDAEGNVTAVDGGSTARYVYDAASRRVRVQTGSAATEYLFDPAGRRVSSWLPSASGAGFGIEGRIWMDGELLATRGGGNMTYFHHTDPLGTERLRTDASGNVATISKSNAFGDGFTQTNNNQNGVALDNREFAGLDSDYESGTLHAAYRQYSSTAGRWMSPDPYDGSYSFNDPQSFNRYAYVSNNPISFTDPSGLQRPQSCTDIDSPCGEHGGGSGGGLQRITSNSSFTGGFGGSWDKFALMTTPVVALQYGENRTYIGGGTCGGNCLHQDYALTPGWGYSQVGTGLDLLFAGVFNQPSSPDAPTKASPSKPMDPDDARILALAQGINRGAGALNDPKAYAYWYGAGLLGAGGAVVVADVAAGAEGSLLFGRGYYGWTGYLNGNAPWGAALRVGFGWNGAQQVVRVSGNLINKISNTGHVDLWPPSAW